jgi:hypothetical protein
MSLDIGTSFPSVVAEGSILLLPEQLRAADLEDPSEISGPAPPTLRPRPVHAPRSPTARGQAASRAGNTDFILHALRTCC